jgi:3-deoxy-D-manno-octulosonic-acid transferase
LIAVYTLAYTLGLILWLPFRLFRYFRGHRPVPFRKRMMVPECFSSPPFARTRLWVHAVSVGEVNSIRPLIDALNLKSSQLCISTTTETGQRLARQLFRDRARIFYFPLDWPWLCRRYLRSLDPAAVLVVETEIWPGFIVAAHELGVPLVLINGRISDRSFARYRYFRRPLRPFLQQLDRLCMQSPQDRDRIVELGSVGSRTCSVGNLKYDYSLDPDPGQAALTRRIRSLFGADPIWVCGSTREREEEQLLDAFHEIKPEYPHLRMVLAPRHPRRSAAISDLLRQRGLVHLQRSSLNGFRDGGSPGRPEVLVLDTIGELPHLYELAQVVFVGGSLVTWGGHNIIEAAHFGKPILVGPHMHNFREMARTFLEGGAALQVRDSGELARRLRELLGSVEARRGLGHNARRILRDNRGAVGRTARIVGEYLGPDAGS